MWSSWGQHLADTERGGERKGEGGEGGEGRESGEEGAEQEGREAGLQSSHSKGFSQSPERDEATMALQGYCNLK